MFCSTGSTSPSSAPSLMIDLISSSVTFPSSPFIPSRLKMSSVLLESNQTKGEAIIANTFIGRAINLATASATLKPIRFGTSSPKIIVR